MKAFQRHATRILFHLAMFMAKYPEMEISSLANTNMEQIHAAFQQAFSDYAEAWNKTVDELRQLLERRGFDPALSFGAFDNGTLVSFTLNGIGMWNGQLTAYDTGTGTIPAYRKQGLAARIFNESVPALKQLGIRQYLLEVIKVNTGAFELYQKQGFKVGRELDYYIGTKKDLALKNNITGLTIKPLNRPDWRLLQQFWEFKPSWQNSVDAMNRKLSSFMKIGVFDGETLAGYGFVDTGTGDIPQLAISQQYRRRGLATALVNELVKYSEGEVVRVINADAAYTPFREFMASIGLKPGHGQYEMIRNL